MTWMKIGRTERLLHRLTDRHDLRELGYVDADRGITDPDFSASPWYRRGQRLHRARLNRKDST